ncbi:Reverse transcriptase domain-containing protein [Halomonas sp. NYA30]
MKRHGGLFLEFANYDALEAAVLKAKKGRRTRGSVLRFSQREEEHLVDILNRLHHGLYRVGGYRHFLVHEPKTRRIAALRNFEDRIVQHAIYAVIEPLFERRFISDSYACRTGKGTHACADRAQQMLRECLQEHGHIYVLKADIRKYFASIPHAVAKRLLRRVIKCPLTLAILDDIIGSYHEPGKPGYGIAIGSLICQLLANIVLDALDQYVKCRLCERWYIRYMDDWLIVGPDKRHLQKLRIHLEWWLAEHLELETNHKTNVFPVSPTHGRGLDFVGYHMWPHKRRLRKGSMKRFKRRVRRLRREYANGEIAMRDVQLQLNSWLAHASHANAEGFVRSVIYDTPWEQHHVAICD